MPRLVPELAHETGEHLAVPGSPAVVDWADIKVLRADAVPLENAVTPLQNVKAQGKPVYAMASRAKGPMGEDVVFVRGVPSVKGMGMEVVANGTLVTINGVVGAVETSTTESFNAEKDMNHRIIGEASLDVDLAEHASDAADKNVDVLWHNAEQGTDVVFGWAHQSDNLFAKGGLLLLGGTMRFGAVGGTVFTRLGEQSLSGSRAGSTDRALQAFQQGEYLRGAAEGVALAAGYWRPRRSASMPPGVYIGGVGGGSRPRGSQSMKDGKKVDLRDIDEAARRNGIPKSLRKGFGEHIHQEKRGSGGWGEKNGRGDFTDGELDELAKDFLKRKGLSRDSG